MKKYWQIWSDLRKSGLPLQPSLLEREVWNKDFQGGRIYWNMLGITVSTEW